MALNEEGHGFLVAMRRDAAERGAAAADVHARELFARGLQHGGGGHFARARCGRW